jgi:hypothetical protein
VLLAGIFAACLLGLPHTPLTKDQSRLVGTLEVLGGLPLLPGAVAYMLLGGVHNSTLGDGQVITLMSAVAGAFWATLLPSLRQLRHPIRRFRAWRDAL